MDVHVLVGKAWAEAGSGCPLGNPALVSWREGRALAAGHGDVRVRAVGVCVGDRNGSSFSADLCS